MNERRSDILDPPAGELPSSPGKEGPETPTAIDMRPVAGVKFAGGNGLKGVTESGRNRPRGLSLRGPGGTPEGPGQNGPDGSDRDGEGVGPVMPGNPADATGQDISWSAPPGLLVHFRG